MLETLEEITSCLDNGEGVDVVFLDYRKAFDSVPHRRLIHKLSRYGFGGHLLSTRIRPVLVKHMIILASYVNKWTFI